MTKVTLEITMTHLHLLFSHELQPQHHVIVCRQTDPSAVIDICLVSLEHLGFGVSWFFPQGRLPQETRMRTEPADNNVHKGQRAYDAPIVAYPMPKGFPPEL